MKASRVSAVKSPMFIFSILTLSILEVTFDFFQYALGIVGEPDKYLADGGHGKRGYHQGYVDDQ
jgi:hypothetical protein